MALSSIVRKMCPTCGKVAVEKSKISFGNHKIVTLECGHTIANEVLSSQIDIVTILNGCSLMPYQVEAVKFLENADAKALLADEQGLGKTIEALALIKLHKDELLPCIIVCPTTVKLQWHHEILAKCGTAGFLTQVISSNKEMAAPGFDIYITTYDMIKNEKCFDLVKDKIKFIIIDECQRIKNHLSQRAKAIQKVAKDLDHILPMSGTPIKNNAGEYFTVLNLVRPQAFPHYTHFVANECDSYNNGWGFKVGGLKDPEAFHEKTKEFILRRTKEQVLPDLPQLSRKFFHVELDRKLNKAYDAAMKELDDLMYSDEEMTGLARASNMLAIYNKMRQITGISKVEQCIDWTTEFLMSCDRKLVIFVHHHAVANKLEVELNQWLTDGGFAPCLNLTAQLGADERQNMAETFHYDDKRRVMIASTLATGEGLNLQFCSDAIMLERQWNPANEEQAEGRFHRFGQLNPVSVTYMLASETIDDYFTELVEQKRSLVAATMDNKDVAWDTSSLMTELATVLLTRGRKAWKL